MQLCAPPKNNLLLCVIVHVTKIYNAKLERVTLFNLSYHFRYDNCKCYMHVLLAFIHYCIIMIIFSEFLCNSVFGSNVYLSLSILYICK